MALSINKTPYLGLQPFSNEDSNLFFGREQFVEELSQQLSSKRFLTLAGSSGSGKSSLIKAGLIPFLQKNNDSFGGRPWHIIQVYPGFEPLRNLIRAFSSEEETAKGTQLNKTDSQSIIKNALDSFKKSFPLKEENILIVIEQFEEVFGFAHSSERKREVELFIKILKDLFNEVSYPIYIIIEVRAAFLEDCSTIEGLSEQINECFFLLPPLNKEDVLSMILKPAQLAGAQIEHKLAERIFEDTKELGPDRLPLLQYLLLVMWKKGVVEQSKRILDLSDYEAMGDIRKVISVHGDEVYQSLNEKEQKIAEGLFPCLIYVDNDNRIYRQPCQLDDIAYILNCPPGEIRHVVDRFFHMRFLSMYVTKAVDIININNDIVNRHWDRLQNWMEKERVNANHYTRLRQSSELYESGNAGLLRQPELGFALRWLKEEKPSSIWANKYGGKFEQTLKYIQKSENAIEREGKSKPGKSPGGVFICYRHEDTASEAREFKNNIGKRFSSERVFMDVKDISLGENFEEKLDETLENCSVVLVLIGKDWLKINKNDDKPRLHQSNDPVRKEIKHAILLNKRVIPILLQDVIMPTKEQLPQDLVLFSEIQGIKIKHESFDDDFERLVKGIQKNIPSGGTVYKLVKGLKKVLQ